MADDSEDEVESELMVLTSIYEDKISIEKNKDGRIVKITIYPATAESLNSQYVCLQISFLLDSTYPRKNPEISFNMSRGLSDSNMNELLQKMKNYAEEHSNQCILFDLMEMAKDVLTSNNVPSCSCSVCLIGFHECDDFLKTDCYHYFHSFCMNQYFSYHLHETCEESDRKVKIVDGKNATASCPVCRKLINLNIESLEKAQPPLNEFNLESDQEFNNHHMKLFEVEYERQLQNGGLIDLEYEKNKYLLSNIEQVYLRHIAEKKNVESDGMAKSDLTDVVNNTESMSLSNTSAATASRHDFEQKKSYPSTSGSSRGNSRTYYRGQGNRIPRNRKPQTFANLGRQQKPNFRQQKEYRKVDRSQYNNSAQQNNGRYSPKDFSHRKFANYPSNFKNTRPCSPCTVKKEMSKLNK